jgi:flagellar biosynthesis chaperone FliJ
VPPQAQIEGVVYRPALMASAQVRILDRKLGVDSEITRAAFVPSPEKRGSVRWDEHIFNGHGLENAETSPAPSARFGSIDAPLNDAKLMTALQKDFADWIFRNSAVQARANEALKVYAGPDVSRAEFMKACSDAASEKRDAEIEKATARIDRQIKSLEDRLAREERELAEDQVEHEHRKWEERGNLAELGAGLLGIGRKKSLSTQLSKRRLTEKAKAEVEESIDAIAEFKTQIADLEKQREQIVTELNDKWGRVVNEISEVTVSPRKTDVFVNLFGVGWMPYYIVNTGAGKSRTACFWWRISFVGQLWLHPRQREVLWLFLGVVHSITASLGFKNFLRRSIGDGFMRLYRLMYNVFSVVSFAPILYLMVALPDRSLYQTPPPWSYLMLAGQGLLRPVPFSCRAANRLVIFCRLAPVVRGGKAGGTGDEGFLSFCPSSAIHVRIILPLAFAEGLPQFVHPVCFIDDLHPRRGVFRGTQAPARVWG